jgi:hypothetical protein
MSTFSAVRKPPIAFFGRPLLLHREKKERMGRRREVGAIIPR